MTSHVQEHNAADLSVDQIRHIVELVDSMWPSKTHESIEDMVHGTQAEFARVDGKKIFAVWEDGKVIACGETFPRVVRCAEREFEVLALASVCVAVDHRGKGYGKGVVELALSPVAGGQFPVALFQTAVPDFYKKNFDAIPVENEFVNSASKEPDARPWWDPYVMICPNWQDWPKARVDMNGPGY